MSDRDELTDYESDIKEYTDFIHAGIDYRIEKIIALVRADERKRIREELEAEYERVKEENTGLMGDYDLETAGTLSGLSFAIGLAEEGGER